jgi:hypothetical protein
MILLDQRGAGPVVKKSGRLTAEQIAGLSKLFDGWQKLKPTYPGVPDGPDFEIRYGGRTVRSGAGTIEPKTLRAIRERLEALAESLDTKQD